MPLPGLNTVSAATPLASLAASAATSSASLDGIPSAELLIEQELTRYQNILADLADGMTPQDAVDMLMSIYGGPLFSRLPSPAKGNSPLHRLIYLISKLLATLLNTKLDKPDESLKYYERALSVDDTDPLMWKSVATILYGQEDFEAACNALLKGHEHATSAYLRSYFTKQVCECLFELGDYSACIKYVNHVIKTDPSYTRASEIKAEIIREYSQGAAPFSMIDPLYGITNDDLLKYSTSQKTLPLSESTNTSDVKAAVTYNLQKDLSSRSNGIRRKKAKYKKYAPTILTTSKVELKEATWIDLGISLLNLYSDVCNAEDEGIENENPNKDEKSETTVKDLFNPIEIVLKDTNVNDILIALPSLDDQIQSIPGSPMISECGSNSTDLNMTGGVTLDRQAASTASSNASNTIKRKAEQTPRGSRQSKRVKEIKSVVPVTDTLMTYFMKESLHPDTSNMFNVELKNLQLINHNIPKYIKEFLARLMSNSIENLTFNKEGKDDGFPLTSILERTKDDSSNGRTSNSNEPDISEDDKSDFTLKLLNFVNEINQSNSGVLDVMRRYVVYMIVHSGSDTSLKYWPQGNLVILVEMINCLEMKQSVFSDPDGLDVKSMISQNERRASSADSTQTDIMVDSNYTLQLVGTYMILFETILDFCEKDDIESRDVDKLNKIKYRDVKFSVSEDRNRLENILNKLDGHIITALSFIQYSGDTAGLKIRFLYNIARMSTFFPGERTNETLTISNEKFDLCFQQFKELNVESLPIDTPTSVKAIDASVLNSEISSLKLRKSIFEADECFEKKDYKRVIEILEPIFISEREPKSAEAFLNGETLRNFLYKNVKTNEIFDMLFTLCGSYREVCPKSKLELVANCVFLVHILVFFDTYGEFDDLFIDLVNTTTNIIEIIEQYDKNFVQILSKYSFTLPIQFIKRSQMKELFYNTAPDESSLTLLDYFIAATTLITHIGWNISGKLDSFPYHIQKRTTQSRIENAKTFMTHGYILYSLLIPYFEKGIFIVNEEDKCSIKIGTQLVEQLNAIRSKGHESFHMIRCFFIRKLHDTLASSNICNEGRTYFHERAIKLYKKHKEVEASYKYDVAQCYTCILGCQLYKTRDFEYLKPKNRPANNLISTYINNEFYKDLESYLFEAMYCGNSRGLISSETLTAVEYVYGNLNAEFIKSPTFKKNMFIQQSKTLVNAILEVKIDIQSISSSKKLPKWNLELNYITDSTIDHLQSSANVAGVGLHKHLYYIVGKTSYCKVDSRRKTIDDVIYEQLQLCINSLKIDLYLNSNRFQSWLTLGNAYVILAEYEIENQKKLIDDSKSVIKTLRMAFNCFAVVYRMAKLANVDTIRMIHNISQPGKGTRKADKAFPEKSLLKRIHRSKSKVVGRMETPLQSDDEDEYSDDDEGSNSMKGKEFEEQPELEDLMAIDATANPEVDTKLAKKHSFVPFNIVTLDSKRMSSSMDTSKNSTAEFIEFMRNFANLCYILSSRPLFGWYSDEQMGQTKPEFKSMGVFARSSCLSVQRTKLWDFGYADDLYPTCYPKWDSNDSTSDDNNDSAPNGNNTVTPKNLDPLQTSLDDIDSQDQDDNDDINSSVSNGCKPNGSSTGGSTKKRITKSGAKEIEQKLIKAVKIDQKMGTNLLNVAYKMYSWTRKLGKGSEKWIDLYYMGVIEAKKKNKMSIMYACWYLIKAMALQIEQREKNNNDTLAKFLNPGIKLMSISCNSICCGILSPSDMEVCLMAVKMYVDSNSKSLLDLSNNISANLLTLKPTEGYEFGKYSLSYSSVLPVSVKKGVATPTDEEKLKQINESIANSSHNVLSHDSSIRNTIGEINYELRSAIIGTLEILCKAAAKAKTNVIYHNKDIYLLARAYAVFALDTQSALSELQKILKVQDRIWKVNAYVTLFELPSKHEEHIFKCTMFYVDLLVSEKDTEKLKTLQKKLSEKRTSYRAKEVVDRINLGMKTIP